MKVFYFDVETTGLDSKINDIVTMSLIIEVDGIIKEKAEFKMQPFNWDSIQEEALKVNGLTREQLKTFDDPKVVKNKIQAVFDRYVDKYKKNKTSEDKLIPAGYNVLFDIGFLSEFWKKCGDNYFGAYIDYHKLDIASIVLFLKLHGVLKLQGYKLKDVSEALGVTIVAHDATSDIMATREVAYKLLAKIKELK